MNQFFTIPAKDPDFRTRSHGRCSVDRPYAGGVVLWVGVGLMLEERARDDLIPEMCFKPIPSKLFKEKSERAWTF